MEGELGACGAGLSGFWDVGVGWVVGGGAELVPSGVVVAGAVGLGVVELGVVAPGVSWLAGSLSLCVLWVV